MASSQIAFRSYYDDTGMLVWHTYSRVNKRAVFCIEPHCSEESCWLGGRCESCEHTEESYLPSGHCEPTGEHTEESCSLSDAYEECLGCAGPSSPGANGYCAACWTQRYGCVEEPSPCAQCGETFDVGLAIDASRCPRCILSPCCPPQPAIECSTCGCTAEFRDGERVCWCDACQKDGCYYGEDGCICCYQKDHVCSGEIDYERGIRVCDDRDEPACPQMTHEDTLIEIKNRETMLTWDRTDEQHAIIQQSLERLRKQQAQFSSERRNSVTSPPLQPTCTICGSVVAMVPDIGICFPCKQATRRYACR